MRRAISIVVGMLVLIALAGCAGQSPASDPTGTDPNIRGVITSIEFGEGENASARVVWTEDAAVGPVAEYDAAQVTIGEDTDVRTRTDAGDEPASSAELKIGTVVEAWFTGGVRESYPVQATASAVIITGTYDGELPTPPGLEP